MTILVAALLAAIAVPPVPPPSPVAPQVVVAPQADEATLRADLAKSAGHGPLPADVTDLDTLLRQKDPGRLTARLRDEHDAAKIALDLNWARDRIFGGAGFIAVYAYMFDLWRLGSTLPPAKGDGLKRSAAMMFVYATTLTMVDGARCADPSAPGHRRDQLFGQNRDLAQYLVGLPRPVRMQLGTVALSIEKATLPLRTDDYVLCSGGLDQMSAGLAQGAGAQTVVPTPPGMVGKTVAVATPPGWEPKFVAPAVWQEAQAQARPKLAEVLTDLLTVPSDSPPPPRNLPLPSLPAKRPG